MKKSKINILLGEMMKVKTTFKKRFSFDSQGLSEAHRYLIQTIIDHRDNEGMHIQCLFYSGNRKSLCSIIEFQRRSFKPRGVYGMKGQNEVALMKKMLKWQGEGILTKKDVVGSLTGKNLPISDFKRFRSLVEESGVIVDKSRLLFGRLA